MKLIYSPTSPYARKVRMVILECGFDIELVPTKPLTEADEMRSLNPLGKVPSLVLDDESVLVDSPLLCEYLIREAGNEKLLPTEGPERWLVLQRQALADGIMDAAFNIVMEKNRPDAKQSDFWLQRWQEGIANTLKALEKLSPGGTLDLGDMALLAALAYLDFRLPDMNWRANQPRLDYFLMKNQDRKSFLETAPPT